MNPENPTLPEVPPPANPKWHRFANNVINCQSLVDSYLDAFPCTKATAYVNSSRLRKKPEVAAYIEYWINRQYAQRLAARKAGLPFGG